MIRMGDSFIYGSKSDIAILCQKGVLHHHGGLSTHSQFLHHSDRHIGLPRYINPLLWV